jgi:dipeptidyl aminopeptidase/acylaminoacyl peptidase
VRKLLSLTCLALLAATPAWATPLHQFDSLSFSPAGDRLADVEALDPGNLPALPHGAVMVRGADGKILAQYDPCKSCKYSDTAWSAKGVLAFVASDETAGKASLFVVDKGAPRLAAAITGVANTLRWSPDGARIALLVTLGAHKKTGAVEAGAALVGEIGVSQDEQRIAILPAAGGALKVMSPSDTYIYEFDWTPDSKGFAATGAKGNGDNNWWVATLDYVDAQTGALRLVASPKMQMNLPRVSPDGKSVAFVGGLMSDWGPIGGDVYTVPLAGGAPTDITPNFAGSFNAIAWRGKGLLTSALIGDRYAVMALDPKPRTLWSAPVSAKTQHFDGAIAFSANGAMAATLTEDFTHAQEIAFGPVSRLAPITHENDALAPQVAAQSVRWNNEGHAVQGWLLGPQRIVPGRKYPMVVIVHGGPSSASTPHYVAAGGQHGTGFDFTADLVARGYYIFLPNPRGSFGQGEAFTRGNIRDFGRGDLRDDLAGVDAAEKIAPIDDKRLGMYGHSYGGWMTMWANTQTQRFKAMVSGAGIANWTSYYGQNGIDQWMVPFFGASVYDDPAVYRAASPIEFIKQAKTPVLVYVGERDVECPAPQSLEYWHALKETGTPVQLFIYAGEGHRFHKPSDLIDLRARIIGWFGKYLK